MWGYTAGCRLALESNHLFFLTNVLYTVISKWVIFYLTFNGKDK